MRVDTMQPGDSEVARMSALAESWEQCGDSRSIFLRCYGLMTQSMLAALRDDRFQDPQWVSELLHHFADYYFDALDRYEQGYGNTPQIWTHAHDASRERDLFVLQHLALGVNAHINYDLIFALADMLLPEWPTASEQLRQQRYQDHCKVNAIIAETVDNVQDSVVEEQVPWFDLIDEVLGPIDEMLVSRLIANWRDEVWEQAVEVVEAQGAERTEALRQQIEAQALQRAGLFAPAVSF